MSYKDPDTLERLYHNEKMSQLEIANEFGVSQATVHNWMDEFDIETRSNSESHMGEFNPFYGKNHSDEWREEKSRMTEEWLKENKHPMEGKSHDRVSIQKMSKSSSGQNHPFYGEERSIHSKRMREDGNPNWLGGHDGYYGPSWSEELKEEVRESENRICPSCGVEEDELRRKLDVHHIIPFRYFGLENHEEANDEENLVALCPSCHHEMDNQIMRIEKIYNGEIIRQEA